MRGRCSIYVKVLKQEEHIQDITHLVSVVIVNFNAGAWLQKCLDSLARQTYTNFEALILDNGSTDFSLKSLILPDERFVIHELGQNLGFAAANNAGAWVAKGKWLATLNPDAFPEPDWLDELITATSNYPDVVMFGSTQWQHDQPGVLDGAGDCMSFFGLAWRGGFGQPWVGAPPHGEVFSPCAAAALYKTDAFKTAGGFCERLFCYNEDVDLGFRLRLMGHRAIQVSRAQVRHVSGGSSEGGEFATYHGHRNAFWVNIINTPWPLLPLTLFAHIFAETALLIAKLPGTFAGKNRAENRVVWRAMARGFYHSLFHGRWAWRERAKIQSKRKASIFALAKSLCWSPQAFLRKTPNVKAVRNEATRFHF